MDKRNDNTFEIVSEEELNELNKKLEAGENITVPESLSEEKMKASVDNITQDELAKEEVSKAKRDKKLAARILASVAVVAIVVSSVVIVKPWERIVPKAKPSKPVTDAVTPSDYSEIEKKFEQYAANYKKASKNNVSLFGLEGTKQEAAFDKAPGANNTSSVISAAGSSQESGTLDSNRDENKTEHGETNEQVKGVSEADIIKNDGKYLYTVLPENADWDTYYREYEKYSNQDKKDDSVMTSPAYDPNEVTTAVPASTTQATETQSSTSGKIERPKLSYTCAVAIIEPQKDGKLKTVGTINIDAPKDANVFYMAVTEIYVSGDRLTAIVNITTASDDESNRVYFGGMYDYGCYTADNTMTMAVAYDISDRTSPKEEWRVFQDGHYISSRMAGDEFILLSSYYVPITNDDEYITDNCVPKVGTNDKEYSRVSADSIYMMQNICDSRYLVASVMNCNDKTSLKTRAVLGGGENVYCTTENLYVTSSKNETLELGGIKTDAVFEVSSVAETSTEIYKLDITNYDIKVVADASVTGTALNQFSIDEYDGYLRIATTSGFSGENTVSQLYVLDPSLKTVGLLENISKGEVIKSVRFTGNTAYVVTFEQTDPLFVIDLSNPAAPAIKGELKIPGFSTYLHPVSDSLVLGIGVDGDENGAGNGLKVSLFDVSDPTAPKEAAKYVIPGKEYTDYKNGGSSWAYIQSPAFYDHKAVCFDSKNNIMYITYSKYENFSSTDINIDDTQTAGVLAIKVDVAAKTISESKTYTAEALRNDYDDIRRTTYTGSLLFALTNSKLVSFDIESAKKLDTLTLTEIKASKLTSDN